MAGLFDDLPALKSTSNGLFGDLPPLQLAQPETGLLATIKGGAGQTARSAGAALDLAQGDLPELQQAVSEQQSRIKDPRLQKFEADLQARKEQLGQDPGWIDTIGAVGKAAWQNPSGFGLMMAEQLPNSAAVMAAGGAGALAGSALGPAGTVAGGVIGGIGGMFAGNVALESGSRALEHVAKTGALTDQDRGRLLTEGAIKAGVITGVDALTFGASKWVTGTAKRAAEVAAVRVAEQQGVPVAEIALRRAADPAFNAAVESAEQLAVAGANQLGKRALQTGAALTLETIGEGAGEYLGEFAATGEADKMDAVIESFSSLGQSAAEVAIGKALNRRATAPSIAAITDPSSTVDQAAQAAAAFVDDANVLGSMGFSQDEIAAITADPGLIATNQPTSPQGPSNGPTETAETPAEAVAQQAQQQVPGAGITNVPSNVQPIDSAATQESALQGMASPDVMEPANQAANVPPAVANAVVSDGRDAALQGVIDHLSGQKQATAEKSSVAEEAPSVEPIVADGIPISDIPDLPVRRSAPPPKSKPYFAEYIAARGLTMSDLKGGKLATVKAEYDAWDGKSDPNAVEAQKIAATPAVEREGAIGAQQEDDLPPAIEVSQRAAPKAGTITDAQFSDEAQEIDQKLQPAPLKRGATQARIRILQAKRDGELSADAADLADWFIQKNPALFSDVGVSIGGESANGAAGNYNPINQVISLFKGAASDTTAIHEVLHHLERMMPAEMQDAIRKEWLRATTAELQKAIKAKDQARIDYFSAVLAGDTERATKILTGGAAVQILETYYSLAYADYQYLNPSEFWAVRMTARVAAQFAAKDSIWQRSKLWLKAALEKIKAVLGLKSDAPLLRALDRLIKESDGFFVSGKMLWEGETFNAPPPLHTTVNQPTLIPPAGRVPPPQQTSLNIGQGSVQPTWAMPEDNLTEDLIYRLQDNKIDLKRAIEAIRATGRQIGESIDAYRHEERYISRAAERTKQFLEKDMTQLLTLMRLNRVDQEQLGRYLWARHAEEANAHIAKINPNDPDMQDGGSGLLTQESKDYLAGKKIRDWPVLTAAELRSMGILAARVDAITKGTRDYLVSEGLLSPSDRAIWEAAYRYYVPLNREDMDTMAHGNGTGQGFSIKGQESKRRTGSKLPVADVLGNIAQQRVKAITRAEKNRVAIALYGLVLTNPNPDFWKADAPPKIKVIQKIQGVEQVVEMVDPLYKSKDNVIIAKVYNQRSGKVEERSVLFNERNERAMRLARAMKNLDGTQMGELMSAAAMVTRYFASINTQYNPIFGIVNLVRDVQTAAINLSSTPLAGHKLKVMNNTRKILGGALRHWLRDFDGPWRTLAEEYRLEGGATGFMENFRTGKERAESLEKILDPDWWAKTKWGKALTLNGVIDKPVTLAVDKALRPLAEWIADFNTVMEQATRLAAYDVAKNDLNMSKAAAASLAKNLTVNFNRKGELGTQIGSLYAFFNASMQGSARMAETILKRDSNGKYRVSKAGKQIIGGGVLLGALQAMALMAAGFDDDEPPEFVRARNLLIPTGGKDYISIPMPLGFNVLPNLGRLTVEAISHPKKAKDKATDLIGTIADSFNPLGGSAPISQIISPTITDPLIALATNTDWTGKPIARQDFNSLAPTPGFTRAKDVASAPSRWLAEAINTLTFGTKDKQGILSPTPDQIDYLIGQVTGGVGREALKASATASALTSGEELPWHKIPFAGRFYGSTEGQSSQGNTFYANIKAMNEHEASIKGRAKRGESVAEYMADNPEAKLYKVANTTDRIIQGLKRQKRAAVEREDKEAVRRYEQAITATMQRFNQRVAQAEAK